MVAVARRRADRLELVVVDVSGKGEQAGTRALLLSGAFGGLLGALPPDQFLPAANDYLLRQDWDEGFATAVHLSLDLATGAFELRTAGHPPARLRCTPASGRWTVHEAEGPVLGLIEDADFTAIAAACCARATRCCSTPTAWSRPRERDIALGIDQLLGPGRAAAARRVRRAAPAAGRRARIRRDDDRALVLVHRR